MQNDITVLNLLAAPLIACLAVTLVDFGVHEVSYIISIIALALFKVKSYIKWELILDTFAPQVDGKDTGYKVVEALVNVVEAILVLPSLFLAVTAKSDGVTCIVVCYVCMMIAAVIRFFYAVILDLKVWDKHSLYKAIKIVTASGEVEKLEHNTGIYFLNGVWLVYNFDRNNREYKYYKASDVTVVSGDKSEITPENYKEFIKNER